MPPRADTKLDIQDLIRTAERSAEIRKGMPLSGAMERRTIVAKQLITKYMDPLGGQDKPDGFHGMFTDGNRLREYAQKGYRPVLSECDKGDLVVNPESAGDVLVCIPTSIYHDILKADVLRSERLIQAKVMDKSDSPVALKDDGAQVARPGTAEWEREHKDAGVVTTHG